MADIKLVDIEKHFGKNHVVRKLNLDIKDREFVVLLGRSGCGKTTMLRSIAGLEEVDSGEILIEGRPVQHLKPSDRDVAFVFQNYALYPHLNVYENISFSLKATRSPPETIKKRVAEVARALQIESILKKNPSTLNSGDMQRVALARALVRRPKAILMDEPIGSLDAKLREEMRTELKRLHIEMKNTTLYVTHDQVEAMSMADRIAIMEDGVLQQVGSPVEVYDHPANLFVAQFIGSPIMNVLDCKISLDANGTLCHLGQGATALPLHFSSSVFARIKSQGVHGDRLKLGFRPESVRVSKERVDGFWEVKVDMIEPVGPYDIIELKMGGQWIRFKTPAKYVERVGDSIWIRLDEQRIHFFDETSGKVLEFRP